MMADLLLLESGQLTRSATRSGADWPGRKRRPGNSIDRFAIILDVLMVVTSAIIACILTLHFGGIARDVGFWQAIRFQGNLAWASGVLVAGYALTVILVAQKLSLYSPDLLSSVLHEQRLIFEASSIVGLMLAATLYLLHPRDTWAGVVVGTVGIAPLLLSSRRLVFRLLRYRGFIRPIGTRNTLIIGTGPTAQAVRNQLQTMRHLGYCFKGFIELQGNEGNNGLSREEIIGTLSTVGDVVQKQFIDEILFASAGRCHDIQEILRQAKDLEVDVRLIPELYENSQQTAPIEYLGKLLTVPLYRRKIPQAQPLTKRTLDIGVSLLAMAVLSPLFLVVAIMIMFDSPGPIFYLSSRLGKRGRVFCCYKFRTMVQDAERLRADLLPGNTRDRVLFKLDDDPRVTPFGRFLRKYSMDELPQFLNVLLGDMSVVGPRPPLAGEVRQYRTYDLRRLDVTPGITGLWQVQARKDPSFDRYVSLDMTYIENWSIWLDLEIMIRTIGVVLSGTGS